MVGWRVSTAASNGWLNFSQGGGDAAEGELPKQIVLAGHRSKEGGLETRLAAISRVRPSLAP